MLGGLGICWGLFHARSPSLHSSAIGLTRRVSDWLNLIFRHVDYCTRIKLVKEPQQLLGKYTVFGRITLDGYLIDREKR
jgi:hypothetical protein